MHGFAGQYSHRTGDRFIFKGGTTWDHTAFEMDIEVGGVEGQPDYYGVDPTWFAGSSWSRPVWSGDHTHLGAGDNLVFLRTSWVVLDNIELKQHTAYASWGPASVQVVCSPHLLLTNLWVHDWALDASLTADDAHGGVIGVYWSGCSNEDVWLDHSEVSNVEAQTWRQNGDGARSIGIRYSKIHDVGTGLLFGYMHDSEMWNVGYPAANTTFDPTFHTNTAYIAVWEGQDQGRPGFIYNNYIHDVATGSGAFYPSPGCGTVYFFNNVVMNNHWHADVAIDTEWASPGCGAVYILNNTMENPTPPNFPNVLVVDRGYPFGTVVIQNNHFIAESAGDFAGPVNTLVNDHNLLETHAEAAAHGYTLANHFAPTSTSSPTANAGTNLSTSCTLSSALCSTTSLGGSMVPSARPSSAAWNIGAY
jgi:hypothetical protein